MHSIDQAFDVIVAGSAVSSGAVCEKTVEIPQLHSSYSCLDKVVDMPVVSNDKCPWFSVQKNAKVPQLQRSFKVADVPVVQVVLEPQVLCGYGRPVIVQRQVWVSSTVEMPQIPFIARVSGHLVVQQRLVRSF